MELKIPTYYRRERCSVNEYQTYRIEALEKENRKLREQLKQKEI